MALVYRAHFALIRNPITNSEGTNTSAIFGFLNTLLTLLEREKPTHLAVAFDTSAPTPRHQLYPEYKAQRDAMPEELAAAIPEVKALCQAMNIPVLELDGFEADDIIGTLAHQAEQQGDIQTFMVTPDKDFAQLVAERTFIWKPGRQGSDHQVLGLAEILSQWEVQRPSQVIDILGLWGDASDNIPGIPGIGEKTAKKLIARFGDVETLVKSADQLKGKQKENVTHFAEQGLLSKKLATIILDVPIPQKVEDLRRQDWHAENLRSLLEKWEFRSLTRRLFPDAGQNSPQAEREGGAGRTHPKPVFESLKTASDVSHRYHHLTTKKAVTQLVRELAKADLFCFDVETNGLDRFQSTLLGVAISHQPHQAYYIPAELLPELTPALCREGRKCGHNLKFDLHILRSHGVEVAGPFFDTMLAHILLAPEQKHTMDYLSESLLGYAPIKLADLFAEDDSDDLFSSAAKKKARKGELDPSQLDPSVLANYAAEDADVTLQLAQKLEPELEKAGLLSVYREIEAPLLPVLVSMEAEGITVDQGILNEVGTELRERLDILALQIEEAAGKPFNLNSPKQLGEILFGEMKLVDKPKKTKTGQYQTNEQILSTLAPKHPIVADILSYREATKLKNTYVDALPEHRSPHSQRVHTHLHQLVAATGRLASTEPNLQNIPIRTELGRHLRRAFVPRGKEFTLMAADYSQIELRVMAALAEDPTMIVAFQNDADIHTATAAKVYGVPESEVLPEMRRTAKMVNFGIIYGISAFGLSQRLGIPREEAATVIKNYFAEYPAVKVFMERTVSEAKECGYVETLGGRRRYFPDLNSSNKGLQANAERAAINTPIQGTAADMIKLAMIEVQGLLKGCQSRMILQVHDELLFDLHREEAAELTPRIVQAMAQALPLPHEVPVRIETGSGQTWLEAH